MQTAWVNRRSLRLEAIYSRANAIIRCPAMARDLSAYMEPGKKSTTFSLKHAEAIRYVQGWAVGAGVGMGLGWAGRCV